MKTILLLPTLFSLLIGDARDFRHDSRFHGFVFIDSMKNTSSPNVVLVMDTLNDTIKKCPVSSLPSGSSDSVRASWKSDSSTVSGYSHSTALHNHDSIYFTETELTNNSTDLNLDSILVGTLHISGAPKSYSITDSICILKNGVLSFIDTSVLRLWAGTYLGNKGVRWDNVVSPTLEYNSVCWGDTIFVAVSNDSGVVTSPTGETWTQRTDVGASTWQSVAFGNETYVAVAHFGTPRVMTSPDGTTWTSRSPVGTPTFYCVCYGEPDGSGLFVAVGAGGVIQTSPDGITWTSRTASESNQFNGICWGDTIFVAVCNDGTFRVQTSPDGITWTGRTAAEASTWRSVSFGGGIYSAVANTGTTRLMTSPDGTTWTLRNPAVPSIAWESVRYCNNQFVACGGTQIMTSSNGLAWTQRNFTGLGNWNEVAYGYGYIVIVGSSGTYRILRS